MNPKPATLAYVFLRFDLTGDAPVLLYAKMNPDGGIEATEKKWEEYQQVFGTHQDAEAWIAAADPGVKWMAAPIQEPKTEEQKERHVPHYKSPAHTKHWMARWEEQQERERGG